MTDKHAKATRQILEHIDRVRTALEDFRTDGISPEGTLMQITIDLMPAQAHALLRFMRRINEADVLPVDQARVFEVASDALGAELTDALAKK